MKRHSHNTLRLSTQKTVQKLIASAKRSAAQEPCPRCGKAHRTAEDRAYETGVKALVSAMCRRRCDGGRSTMTIEIDDSPAAFAALYAMLAEGYRPAIAVNLN